MGSVAGGNDDPSVRGGRVLCGLRVGRLRDVRVRTIELRILAAMLVVLWFAAFGLVLLGYRPGGPVDLLVGLAAAGPILIAVAAVAWPPVTRGDRAFAATAWLALAAVLLLIPSIAGLVAQLVGRGPQTLLPSFEAAYPWLVALAATALFAGLGLARRRLGGASRRRRRLAVGAAFGLVMVLAAGTLFSAIAIVNELALGDRAAIASRFGPTDPTLEPPPCNGELRAGSTARLNLRLDGSVDDKRIGQAVLDGIRDGSDFRWTGFAASHLLVGQVGAMRVADEAWERLPGTGWLGTSLAAVENRDLDVPIVNEALTPDNRSVAEDHGTVVHRGGAGAALPDHGGRRHAAPGRARGRAAHRRCRHLALARGPRLLGVHGRRARPGRRPRDGPGRRLLVDALSAVVRFRLTAVDRGLPVTVLPPVQ